VSLSYALELAPRRAAGQDRAAAVAVSDGLLRHAPARSIAELAVDPDLAAAARALVDLVRLRSGDLPDDVTVILCRA
jgi:hypothetical protein